MGNILVNHTDVASHCIDDGLAITETVGVVMGKKIFQDPYNAIKHPMWTSDTKFAHYSEGGAMSKAGDLLHASIIGAGGFKGKARVTDYLFNDGVYTVTVKNMSNTIGASDNYLGILVYKDDNNYVWFIRRDAIGNILILLTKRVGGGFTSLSADIADTGVDVDLELTRSGNVFTGRYDNGGGWQTLGPTTAAIGADCRLEFGGIAGTGVLTADFDNFLPTGTGIYFDTKSDASPIVITYNQQVLSDGPGAIIQFGSASFDEDSNMKYRVKPGTAAWSSVLNSAGIIALGDLESDDGNFDIEAYCEGVNAAASWTDVNIPTIGVGGGGSVFKSAILQSKIIQGVA